MRPRPERRRPELRQKHSAATQHDQQDLVAARPIRRGGGQLTLRAHDPLQRQ